MMDAEVRPEDHPQARPPGVVDRFVRRVMEPGDSPEWQLRRALMIAIAGMLVVIWLVYGVFYAIVGAQTALQISLATAALQALVLLAYAKTRSYYLLSRLTNALSVLALLAVHLALGGFSSSGYVLIYAMTPLFLASALEEPATVKYWLLGTVGVMLLAALGEAYVPHGNPMSPTVQAAFTLANIVGFCNFVLLPSLFHGMRMRAIQQQLAEAREAQLAQKAEHLAQTQAALERQTATAEILKVIAGSPSDVRPVLDAIVHSARRLVGGFSATAWLVQGDRGHLAAFTATDEAGAQALRDLGTLPVAGTYLAAPARTGQPQIVTDTETEPGLDDEWRQVARRRGYRSMLGVPLLHQGQPIGLISVTRRQPGEFAPHIVELLQTFADQAVIAVQNARLFNETKEALEQQTASAEVLRVVSESVSDARPVFENICASLQRLLPGAVLALSATGDDGRLHWQAGSGDEADALRQLFPRPAPGGLLTGTPRSAGPSRVLIRATDADGTSVARRFALVVRTT